MKEIIFDSKRCLKCGLCSKLDPENFEFSGETKLIGGKSDDGIVFKKNINGEDKSAKLAAGSCPGGAIEIVE
ncbi:MAG: ferredoxin [Candidatus Colwellbacteria bacterium]|nr:ferredoxin [Candidatus Colwellbacteria bacterium]